MTVGSPRPTALGLTYEHTDKVLLRDGSYRWVDLSHFVLDLSAGEVDAGMVLSRLLSDEDQYVNRYDVADNAPTHTSRPDQDAAAKARWLANIEAHPDVAVPASLVARLREPYRPAQGPAVHGPYLMSAISTASFDLIDGATARRTLRAWIEEDDEPSPAAEQVEGDLDGILDHLGASSTVFRLRDLGEDAHHANAFIVGPYIEMVTIDLAARTLALMAGGED